VTAPNQTSPFKGPQPRAWLSYTLLDLSEHADAVARALPGMGWIGVRAKEMPAGDRPMMEEIRRAIAECDVLVAIIAHRYGRIPSPEEGGDGRRSWVWIEVEEAEKNGIPVLVFMLEERVPWPAELVDRDDNAGRLREFKSFLGWRKVFSNFSTVEELIAHLGTSLDRIRSEAIRRDPVSSGGEGSSLPPSPRPWFESGVDPLLLAWRLVVDGKGAPDLLLNLDPLRMLEAIDKAEREMSRRAPGRSTPSSSSWRRGRAASRRTRCGSRGCDRSRRAGSRR
jgi:hypothetical protein